MITSSFRFIRVLLWLLLLVLGGYLGYTTFTDTRQELSDSGSPLNLGGPFKAESTIGPITRADMLGRPHLIFFGYTHCPDFCPTTLLNVSSWLESLGSESDNLDIYFVSIDPVRDTVEHLSDYLENFDSRIVGITGSQSQIDIITHAWRVYAEQESDGLFSHSVTTFLMDRQGNLSSTIGYGEDTNMVLLKLRNLGLS